MQRDIYFFLKGIPTGQLVGDSHYFVAQIAGIAEKVLTILCEKSDSFRAFTKTQSDTPIFIFGFRAESDDVKGALKAAHQQVSGLVDGYNLICDSPPKYSDIVLVCEEQSDNARAYVYKQGGWATLQSKNFDKAGQWQARNELLFSKVVQYFDVVAGDSSAPATELRTNLLYAMRMYRHGAESDTPGIEFLSKFSALECLVCGDVRQNRDRLLKERLQLLFDDSEIIDDERVSRLWTLRCSASHQARVYDDIEEGDNLPPSVGTIFVEQLFAGIVFFILENSYKIETTEKLWGKAEGYTLPDIIKDHLPEGLSRMAVSEFTIPLDFGVTGMAALLNDFIAKHPQTFQTAKVTP